MKTTIHQGFAISPLGILFTGLICLGVGVGGSYLFFRTPNTAPPEVSQQLRTLMDRLDAIEQRQTASQAPYHSAKSRSTPGVVAYVAQRQHVERLRNDPEYARQEEQHRQDRLEKAYLDEPINAAWAAQSAVLVDSALLDAFEQSNLNVHASSVDCRSRSCRIRIDGIDGADAYDDLVTFLSVNIADTLPKARLVTTIGPDGKQALDIFASAVPEGAQHWEP
ncbi:hypothetical protein [Marilutibacter alkalisoli]|uniref:Uncharacterized protein n=1 Tax=Marilutibacter alkalisoli TaxID=2591633 RepID=A0A514BUF4_9GAMM|nr:hypothetical protein [Lysobacter alkalisoli]QDH71031.1 hypothetical protein FKV23_13760 [Lysobacter alkalisoli]